jgi:hypothetical protein
MVAVPDIQSEGQVARRGLYDRMEFAIQILAALQPEALPDQDLGMAKKDAQELYKDERIHASVYNAPPSFGAEEAVGDDIFDRSGEVEEEMNIDDI